MAGILVVFGTRPEAIKLAPVVTALRVQGTPTRICVTAQHRELLDRALAPELTPDIDLNLMRPGQSLAALAGRMITALDKAFAAERPERIIVQGDTATAIAAAQANTVVDALHAVRTRLRRDPGLAGPAQPVLDRRDDRRLILVTCHRRESFAAAAEIAGAIRVLAQRPDVLVALLPHPNPAIRRPLEKALRDEPNIALLKPLDLAPFVSLLAAAHFVLTDSGGVQEEAPVLGTPVLVMRDVTERPEGVVAGTARLVGTRAQRIVSEACLLLDNPAAHARMARAHSPYGDGRAADRIAEIIGRAHGYTAEARASAE